MAVSREITLDWQRCNNGADWCSLATVDLANPHLDGLEGVYIIWTFKGRTIYVGQGMIRDRLQDHRDDPRIQQYANERLFVTWAAIGDPATRNGAERYLADQLVPAVGGSYPRAFPQTVNLPR